MHIARPVLTQPSHLNFSGKQAPNTRQLTKKEFTIANGIGVAAPIIAGVALKEPLLFLGMYVAPIPVLLAYKGIRKLFGDNIQMAFRFNPGFPFAGKDFRLNKGSEK
ncbi:MAG TPA: hypothetical protein V6C52_00245 [Coleofasciculaceae cyanobacterium]